MLPPKLNEASRTRYDMAKEIVLRCPPNLGKEIALTGAVAWGAADSESDLEISMWVEKLPTVQVRDMWLHGITAQRVKHERETAIDGSIWSIFQYHGTWIEVGWHTVHDTEYIVDGITNGEIIDHDNLHTAAMLTSALPIREQDLLPKWKKLLAEFPDNLQKRLIADALDHWIVPHEVELRWRLLRRGNTFNLERQLVVDMLQAMRILFALNKVWEPDWKWIEIALKTLEQKPKNLHERLNRLFSMSPNNLKIIGTFELLLDVLSMIPTTHDVSEAIETLSESMNTYKGLKK